MRKQIVGRTKARFLSPLCFGCISAPPARDYPMSRQRITPFTRYHRYTTPSYPPMLRAMCSWAFQLTLHRRAELERSTHRYTTPSYPPMLRAVTLHRRAPIPTHAMCSRVFHMTLHRSWAWKRHTPISSRAQYIQPAFHSTLIPVSSGNMGGRVKRQHYIFSAFSPRIAMFEF